MSESFFKGTIGILVTGIKCITSLIQEYNLRNENVLSLHREILLMRPCIENLKFSSLNSGIHSRLQRLIVLIEEIKIWLEMFAAKSSIRHFFFALIHKKEINKFYIRIQEIKMEMGFEMKVDSYHHQNSLCQQISLLLEKLNFNVEIDKIMELVEYQRQMYEIKLEAHLQIIKDIDSKYTTLVSEYECELDDMRHLSHDMQQKMNLMDERMLDMSEKMKIIESINKTCKYEYPGKEHTDDIDVYNFNMIQNRMDQIYHELSKKIESEIDSKILCRSRDSNIKDRQDIISVCDRCRFIKKNSERVCAIQSEKTHFDSLDSKFIEKRGEQTTNNTTCERKPIFVELGLNCEKILHVDTYTQTKVGLSNSSTQTEHNLSYFFLQSNRPLYTQDDLSVKTIRRAESRFFSLDAQYNLPKKYMFPYNTNIRFNNAAKSATINTEVQTENSQFTQYNPQFNIYNYVENY